MLGIKEQIFVECAGVEESDLEEYLSAEDLIQASTPIIDRAVECIDSTLEQAKLDKEDIDLVILAGGSSQLPGVFEKIRDKIGIRPCMIPQDLMMAISYGAALYQRDLARLPKLKKSVKIMGQELYINISEGGRRSQELVASATQTLPYKTKKHLYANEDGIFRVVIQVKHPDGSFSYLKDRVLSVPPGTEDIDVEFNITINKTIEITVIDSKKTKEYKFEIDSKEMTDDQVTQNQKRLGIKVNSSKIKNEVLQPYIGIDLGTTTSEITYATRTGEIEKFAIKNKDRAYNGYSDYCFPSIIYFPDNEITHAEIANKKAVDKINSKNALVCQNFKIQKRDKSIYSIGNEPITVADLSAMLLGKIWNVAQEELSHTKLEKAVITVPASFDSDACQDTYNAAKQAGIKDITLIDEPTAAYVFYKMTQDLDDEDIRKVLVFDFGGGTTDVAILDVKNESSNNEQDFKDSMYKVLGFGGVSNCGGKHIDDALMQIIKKRFEEEMEEEFDPSSDNELRSEIERAKVKLSETLLKEGYDL